MDHHTQLKLLEGDQTNTSQISSLPPFIYTSITHVIDITFFITIVKNVDSMSVVSPVSSGLLFSARPASSALSL